MSFLRDPADRAFAVLAAATGLAWRVAEPSASTPTGFDAALALMLIAVAKGGLVIHEFMGLRRAPRLWRWLLLGWLVAVCGAILVVRAVT